MVNGDRSFDPATDWQILLKAKFWSVYHGSDNSRKKTKACMLSSLSDHCRVQGFTCVPLHIGSEREEKKSRTKICCKFHLSSMPKWGPSLYLPVISEANFALVLFSNCSASLVSTSEDLCQVQAGYRRERSPLNSVSWPWSHTSGHVLYQRAWDLHPFPQLWLPMVLRWLLGKLVSAHTPEFNFFEKCLCGETSCHWWWLWWNILSFG